MSGLVGSDKYPAGLLVDATKRWTKKGEWVWNRQQLRGRVKKNVLAGF